MNNVISENYEDEGDICTKELVAVRQSSHHDISCISFSDKHSIII